MARVFSLVGIFFFFPVGDGRHIFFLLKCLPALLILFLSVCLFVLQELVRN